MTHLSDLELRKLLDSNPDISIAGHIGDFEIPSPEAQATIANEHEMQVQIIQECDRRALRNPLYGLLYAIPNGGHRHPVVAAKLKAEGVRAGMLDLCVPVPRHGYGAAYIELKYGSGKATAAQLDMMRRLQEAGNWAGVFWTFEDTVNFLSWYLDR